MLTGCVDETDKSSPSVAMPKFGGGQRNVDLIFVLLVNFLIIIKTYATNIDEKLRRSKNVAKDETFFWGRGQNNFDTKTYFNNFLEYSNNYTKICDRTGNNRSSGLRDTAILK